MPELSEPEPPEDDLQQYLLLGWKALLKKIGNHDEFALEVLTERYANLLRRWTRAHLSLSEPTQDMDADLSIESIVRLAISKALTQLAHEKVMRESSVLLRLRQAVHEGLRTHKIALTKLEQTIGSPRAASYERSLSLLQSLEREAIVCVLEFHRSFPQLKIDLAVGSVESARDIYSRAVVRLAEEMSHGH